MNSMKTKFLQNKDKALNFAIGAGIPAGTVLSGTAGGCTGVCGSCGGTCLGGLALAAYLGGRVIFKRRHTKTVLQAEPSANK